MTCAVFSSARVLIKSQYSYSGCPIIYFFITVEWHSILLCLRGVVGLDGEVEGFDLKRTILCSNFGTYHMTWILESPCIPTLFTGYSAFLSATVRVK